MVEPAFGHQGRSQAAQTAWSSLPHGGHDKVRLQVQCAHGHHIAAVYATALGPVFVATVHSHSHGSRDLPDVPHGSQQPNRWFDLLDDAGASMVGDELPAWCDCGHRTLSRSAVRQWLQAGEHRVVID